MIFLQKTIDWEIIKLTMQKKHSKSHAVLKVAPIHHLKMIAFASWSTPFSPKFPLAWAMKTFWRHVEATTSCLNIITGLFPSIDYCKPKIIYKIVYIIISWPLPCLEHHLYKLHIIALAGDTHTTSFFIILVCLIISYCCIIPTHPCDKATVQIHGFINVSYVFTPAMEPLDSW